jgi:hypothetical protein
VRRGLYRAASRNIPTSTARSVRSSSQSISRPADDFGAGVSFEGMSSERETTPEYPDSRLSTAGPADPPPELSRRDGDRIAGERSREDEALRGHKKPSLWKRLLGRRRGSDAEEDSTRERLPPTPPPGPGSSIYPGV